MIRTMMIMIVIIIMIMIMILVIVIVIVIMMIVIIIIIMIIIIIIILSRPPTACSRRRCTPSALPRASPAAACRRSLIHYYDDCYY